MLSNQELVNIKYELVHTFNTYESEYEAKNFVSNFSKRYFLPGLLTGNKCAEIYNGFIKAFNEETQKKIANIRKKLEKDLKELDEYREENSISFTKDELVEKGLTGAGVGAGLGIIFGGPVGLLVALGVGFGAVVNSEQLKTDLVVKIRKYAKEANKKIISHLSDLIDSLITDDDPIEISFHTPDVVDESTLTKEQLEIKNFLEQRGIKVLIHATDIKNYDSIMKYGLLSPKEASRRGIKLDINSNLDKDAKRYVSKMKSTPDDYICLSVSRVNALTMRAYKRDRKIKVEKQLMIDASILWKEIDKDRIYCNINGSCSQLKCGNTIQDFEEMFAETIDYATATKVKSYCRTLDGRKYNETTDPQAEIKFQGYIDPKYIIQKSYEDYDLPF